VGAEALIVPRSERSQRLIGQLELQLEELAAAAAEDTAKTEAACVQVRGEGIELSVSSMADHVGACAATLTPLYELIKALVFAAARIHGDDTTVPVLAKVKTRTGRI
jgi:hypothetical protein